MVTKLWDSWVDGALIADPSTEIYADAERIHHIDQKPTIRQLLHRLAGARGHWVVAGTPEQIADQIEE